MATYRALTDLFLPGSVMVDAGTIINDGPGGLLPAGWIPPVSAVEPLDSAAIQAYWNVGPVGLNGADPNISLSPWWMGRRWSNILVQAPKCRWVRQSDGSFVLQGGGESLGPRI